ncbi:unnamed protein product [Calypogeia fissa]
MLQASSDPNPNAIFVDVGSDCAVVFECAQKAGPSTRAVTGTKRRRKGKVSVEENPPSCAREFYLGRIIMMR